MTAHTPDVTPHLDRFHPVRLYHNLILSSWQYETMCRQKPVSCLSLTLRGTYETFVWVYTQFEVKWETISLYFSRFLFQHIFITPLMDSITVKNARVMEFINGAHHQCDVHIFTFEFGINILLHSVVLIITNT